MIIRFMARFTANSSPTAIMVQQAEANRRQRTMAFDIFLKIDGIKGESNDAQHREEIEAESFSWGASQQGTTGAGGGAGVGKASFQDLRVVMSVSRASPQLFLACAQGRHIKTAVLTCRKAGGRDQHDFLRYILSDALVSSYHIEGQAEDGVPVDEVSFKYAQLKIEYRPQKVDGSLGAPVAAGWNLKTNEPLE
jgi:type VI secretion system secreted protein Hcp